MIYLSKEKIDSSYFGPIKEKMEVNFSKLKKMFFERINKLTTSLNNGLVNLESDEIIIISLVFATLISLIIGFQLGEVNYYLFNGNRVDKHYPGHTYEEFNFNYLIGVSSFIVFGGILYVFLKIKIKR